MKKIIILILFILLLGGIILGLLKSKSVNTLKSDPLNITYKIQGKEYSLVKGVVEKEIAPGSASKEVIRVFGEPVYADLDADADLDAVMYLTQENGGSGTFFYVVVAVNDNGVYKGTDAMFLGDRIAPQNINIIDGRAVANFAERKVGESFAVSPSVGKSIWVNLDVKDMQIGEWVKGFEGEVDSSKMSIFMKSWQWVSVVYNNDQKIYAKNDRFKLELKKDGTFSVSTDCNGIGGEYKIDGKKITFSNMMSTLMYCEGSQEQEFSKILAKTNSFSFDGKGQLIFELQFDSGYAVFK